MPNNMKTLISPLKALYSLRNPCHDAFTLIELLVVIAIIAILAALLLPVLANSKNEAQSVKDLNNVRQILLAMQMYASDSKDQVADCSWQMNYPNWAAAANMPLGPTTSTGFSALLAKQIVYFQKGELGPYLINPKVLMCPMDNVNPLFCQRGVLDSSYVWNGATKGYYPVWESGSTAQIGTYKLAQFKATSILIWENSETNTESGQWNDFANYPDQPISPRHFKGATVGMFGGSAQRMNIKTFYQLAMGNQTSVVSGTGWTYVPASALPNALWCNPGMSNGSPSPLSILP